MPLFARPLLAVLMFTTVTAFTAISTRESISARTPTSVVWKDHAASIRKKRGARFSLHSSADRISEQEATQSDLLDPTVAEKFTVLVCSSDLCSQKRKSLRMDEYSTYSAFWSRIQDQAPSVQVKESPCLGSCKKAPCVAVEHDDYEGTVALEGMQDTEFPKRTFHHVVTEADADRVWSCVVNAIQLMAETEENIDE
jgi:(2Fe-2S) ferredoxin